VTSVDLDNFYGIAGTDESRTTEAREAVICSDGAQKVIIVVKASKEIPKTALVWPEHMYWLYLQRV